MQMRVEKNTKLLPIIINSDGSKVKVNLMSKFVFRDTGIVIQISILQWVVEVFQTSVYLFYMFNYRGKSHEMDKFFSLYMLAFTIIVIPLFYLNGDMKFRTDLANSGYITALKNALK